MNKWNMPEQARQRFHPVPKLGRVRVPPTFTQIKEDQDDVHCHRGEHWQQSHQAPVDVARLVEPESRIEVK